MREIYHRFRKATRGGAALEFALAGPLLLLLSLGTIDFGRAFYYSMTISHAAETGAFYGARSVITSGHSDIMADHATKDAQDLGTVKVTTQRVCMCPNGNKVDCVTGSCTGYGAPRAYVSCLVEKQFNALTNLPKLPDLFTVRREVFVRVQ
jgi:Flp pilus assembly protein TadG